MTCRGRCAGRGRLPWLSGRNDDQRHFRATASFFQGYVCVRCWKRL